MSYALNITKQDDHLYIQATGDRAPDTLLGIAKECIEACNNHAYTRFILDVQGLTGKMGVIGGYEFLNKRLPSLGRPMKLKGAILDLESNRDKFKFFEDVAFNAGINLRVFTTASQALQWLRVSKTSDKP